jgi:hypothetical protein
MIALIIFRQLATRRPVGFLGQNSLRIGSMRCQSSSEISQMVPNGLRRDFRRAMAVAPVAGCGANLSRYNLLRAKGVPIVLG